MIFPLSLTDVGLWLAVMAIILLVTSELLLSPGGYLKNIVIERKRLRLVAFTLGTGFIATVLLRIFSPI